MAAITAVFGPDEPDGHQGASGGIGRCHPSSGARALEAAAQEDQDRADVALLRDLKQWRLDGRRGRVLQLAGRRRLLVSWHRSRSMLAPRGRSRTVAEHSFYCQFPRAYDRDLLRIFSNNPRHRHSPPAAAFIRHHRGDIRRLVSKWTGEYQLTLDQVLDEMIERCRELKLRAVGHERQLRTDFTVLLTAKTVHSLYSPQRRQWIAL